MYQYSIITAPGAPAPPGRVVAVLVLITPEAPPPYPIPVPPVAFTAIYPLKPYPNAVQPPWGANTVTALLPLPSPPLCPVKLRIPPEAVPPAAIPLVVGPPPPPVAV